MRIVSVNNNFDIFSQKDDVLKRNNKKIIKTEPMQELNFKSKQLIMVANDSKICLRKMITGLKILTGALFGFAIAKDIHAYYDNNGFLKQRDIFRKDGTKQKSFLFDNRGRKIETNFYSKEGVLESAKKYYHNGKVRSEIFYAQDGETVKKESTNTRYNGYLHSIKHNEYSDGALCKTTFYNGEPKRSNYKLEEQCYKHDGSKEITYYDINTGKICKRDICRTDGTLLFSAQKDNNGNTVCTDDFDDKGRLILRRYYYPKTYIVRKTIKLIHNNNVLTIFYDENGKAYCSTLEGNEKDYIPESMLK